MENRTWIPALERGSYLAIHAGKYVTKHGQGADHWHGAVELYQRRRAAIGALHLFDKLLAIPPQERGDRFHAQERYMQTAVSYGAVVAVARYLGAMREPVTLGGRPDPWFCGPWGWCLDDVIALPVPVECRGAQGLWSLDDDTLARMREGYLAARTSRTSGATP